MLTSAYTQRDGKTIESIAFKFLWKGTDKVTRLSTINDYGEGGGD